MTISEVPPELRSKDAIHHIDMGFLNRRLCMTALPQPVREAYIERAVPGADHFTQLRNDHLLVTMLLDVCDRIEAPTLLEALETGKEGIVFRSTEKLHACPEIYEAKRVEHAVELPFDFGKPVIIAYHTEHLTSSTGTMTLSEGYQAGYMESIVGLLHVEQDRFRIEPIVIGAPWFDHPRNGDDCQALMWLGQEFGEILPEDIDQFSKMKGVTIESVEQWQDAMSKIPEATVKATFAALLKEPDKKDWGGEANDHFSANVLMQGRRKTAAFLLKGPTNFREMTPEMCGRRGDQIYRLTRSGTEIFVIQHSHLIGEAVRETLRALSIYPGRPRKYCLIDGMATFRIMKAYGYA